MARQSELSSAHSRRRILQAAGLAAGGGLVTSIGGSVAADSHPFAARQGEECVPLEPLRGDEPVEELYEYTYPQDRFDGPPGSDGTSYSSQGTTDLQREDTSIVFLYEGPDGLSLVVVHGNYDEQADEEPGANGDERSPDAADESRGSARTVSFAFDGLPEDGEWVVRDDYYLDDDGEQAESNYDRWYLQGDVHAVHWAYREGRTDGGAFRGLDDEFAVDVAPAFNETAGLADEHDQEPIAAWELLSGDREDPERHELDMEQMLRLQAESCPE